MGSLLYGLRISPAKSEDTYGRQVIHLKTLDKLLYVAVLGGLIVIGLLFLLLASYHLL